LVYGGSLTDSQVEEVNKSFNIYDVANVKRQVVSEKDYGKYMNESDVSGVSLISSTLVAKQDKGKGITVKIVTPDNITRVTEVQYRNAAITAGATDLEIEVSAPVKVTGESALVGVSKALEANGQEVDAKRTEIANQEVSTTAQIAEANKDAKGFDSKLLDNALIQIKTELAKEKQNKGQVADDKKVEQIVKKALKDNKLDGIISDEQVSQLVQFAKGYQQTSAVDSKEVLNQLGDLKDNIAEGVSKFLKSAEEHGVFEKAGDFVKSLWDSIVGFFK
jgi:Predicted secreted protein